MSEANFESLNFSIGAEARAATTQVKSLLSALRSLKTALKGLDGSGSSFKAATNDIATKAEETARRVQKATASIQSAMSNGGSASALPSNFWGVSGTGNISDIATQAISMADAMQAAFGNIQTPPAFADWAKMMGSTSFFNLEAVTQSVNTAKESLSGFDAYFKSIGKQDGWDSFNWRRAEVFGSITQGATNAIEKTKTFSQVSGVLKKATSALTPVMQAAGVSGSTFAGAMSAAAAPISAVVIGIKAAVKVVKMLIKNFKEFVNAVKKVASTLKSLNDKFNPFVKIRKELASLLALAKRQTLRRAINAVIKAISEGLSTGVSNLAEYDERFSATVQSFKNAMGLFKNSVGVAVAPIISYFIPAINALLGALTRAMNTLAKLTALLTGQHTYTIAKDYQDIEDGASGASSAVKDLQRTILGFDEINRLNSQSGSSGGSGSGSGDGISSYLTQEVGDWAYNSWGEALEAFLKWLNSTAVPKLQAGLKKVSYTINNFTREFYATLTYGDVQAQIGQLGANLGASLQTMIEDIDWASLGRAIGIGMQSALNFTANFFRNLNFLEIGARLAEAFNNALEQINIYDLADTVYNVLTAGIKTAVGFLLNADLASLGLRASELINGLVSRLTEDIHNVDWSTFWQNITNGIMNFVHNVDWDRLFDTANEIVDGLFAGLNGILDKLLADKRFVSAIHRFIDLMLKIGWEWFKIKVRAIFGTIGTYIGNLFTPDTATEDPLSTGGMFNGWDYAFGLVQDGSVKVANSLNSVIDATDGVADATRRMKGQTDTSFSGMATSAKTMRTQIDTATRGVSSGFSTMSSQVGTHMNKMRTNVSTQTTNVANSIKSNMNTAKSNAVNSAESLRTGISSKFGSVVSDTNNKFSSVRDTIKSRIGEAKNGIPAFNDVGANIKNGIIGGMGDFKGQLNNWANQFKDHILKNFKIHSPSRWARDAVGGYITEGIAVGMTDGLSSVKAACENIQEGITSQFDNRQFLGAISANANTGRTDIASAIGNQVMSGIASMGTNGNDRPVVCEVYLDRDKIATAVSRGQKAQNRRYSSVAMAY